MICFHAAGQRHIFQIARLLLNRPRLLLLDEPTAHLDPATSSSILQTVRRILPEASMLHVSHDIATVVTCNRILVMDQGKVVEQGQPYYLLQNPSSMLSQMVNTQGEDAARNIREVAATSYATCEAKDGIAKDGTVIDQLEQL